MIYLVVIAGFVFYLLIPGIGAFLIRSRWRSFRRNLAESAGRPILSYRYTDERPFRMYGTLEAVQGDERIWITGGGISAGIDLKGVPILVLPPGRIVGAELPDATPRVYRWGELAALPEGTRIFVTGTVSRSHNLPVFRFSGQTPLIVVVYDCPSEELYPRAIWTGRQRNEYWNPITAPSLGAGFLAELTLALLSASSMPETALLGLVLSLVPLLPFLPPGNVGFYLYRRLWRSARRLRSERDVVRLPLAYRFFPKWSGVDAARLPGGGLYYHSRTGINSPASKPIIGRGPAASGKTNPSGSYHLFIRGKSGAYDPMPAHLIVAEEPSLLAARLHHSATRKELFAVACIMAGIGINAFLVAVALGNLVI